MRNLRSGSLVGGFLLITSLTTFLIGSKLGAPPIYQLGNGYGEMSISPLVWISILLGYASSLSFLVWGKNRYHALLGAMIFFVAFWSPYYLYNYVPGPDSAYSGALTQAYMSSQGAVQTNAVFSWPGIFLITNALRTVLGTSLATSEFVFFGAVSIVLVMSIYLISLRPNVHAGWSVVGFLVLTNPFLVFEFADQTLAVSILFLLFALKVVDKPPRRMDLVSLALFSGLVLSHAFFAVLYLIFLVVLRGRRLMDIEFLGSFALYLGYLTYASISGFGEILAVLRTSVFGNQGLVEFSGIVTSSLRSGASIQTQIIQIGTRADFALGAIIAAFGLWVAWKMKSFSRVDGSIIAAGIVYIGIGFVASTIGWRGLQLVGLAAAISFGYALNSHHLKGRGGKILATAAIAVLFLSIAVPFRINYNNSSYQDLQTGNATQFLLTHVDQGELALYLVPSQTQGNFVAFNVQHPPLLFETEGILDSSPLYLAPNLVILTAPESCAAAATESSLMICVPNPSLDIALSNGRNAIEITAEH